MQLRCLGLRRERDSECFAIELGGIRTQSHAFKDSSSDFLRLRRVAARDSVTREFPAAYHRGSAGDVSCPNPTGTQPAMRTTYPIIL